MDSKEVLVEEEVVVVEIPVAEEVVVKDILVDN